MSHKHADHAASNTPRLSRRAMAVGLALPAAGALTATNAMAQATPVATPPEPPSQPSNRIAINPGELFSGAIVANGFVFTSGMLGIDPNTGELAGDDITSQTEQALANLEATLTAAGSSLDQVVKATVFLANLDDFQAFNEVYRQAFSVEPPARSTFEAAGLALNALVEIEFIAVI